VLAHSADEIHRFVAHRVPGAQDAADIAQEALLRACAKLHTVQGENLRPWLFTVAHNLIIDHYRKKNRFEFVNVAEASLAESEPDLQTPLEGVQVVCESRERMHRWVDCITRHLPLDEQVAVLLADLQGYRDRDSAAIMGTSEASFKLLLHGARAHLRSIADGDCALVSNVRIAVAKNGLPARNGCKKEKDRPARNGNGTLPTHASEGRVCQVPGGNGSDRPQLDVAKGSDAGSGSCPLGGDCRPGTKCCRHVPRFVALRDRLLGGFIGTESLLELGETVEALMQWLGSIM
jgi:RNA polymerase sigma-70 factor (ECF subfamily)